MEDKNKKYKVPRPPIEQRPIVSRPAQDLLEQPVNVLRDFISLEEEQDPIPSSISFAEEREVYNQIVNEMTRVDQLREEAYVDLRNEIDQQIRQDVISNIVDVIDKVILDNGLSATTRTQVVSEANDNAEQYASDGLNQVVGNVTIPNLVENTSIPDTTSEVVAENISNNVANVITDPSELENFKLNFKLALVPLVNGSLGIISSSSIYIPRISQYLATIRALESAIEPVYALPQIARKIIPDPIRFPVNALEKLGLIQAGMAFINPMAASLDAMNREASEFVLEIDDIITNAVGLSSQDVADLNAVKSSILNLQGIGSSFKAHTDILSGVVFPDPATGVRNIVQLMALSNARADIVAALDVANSRPPSNPDGNFASRQTQQPPAPSNASTGDSNDAGNNCTADCMMGSVTQMNGANSVADARDAIRQATPAYRPSNINNHAPDNVDTSPQDPDDFVPPRRPVNTVFIHCSASDNPEHDDISIMNTWHVRDRGWSEVGYHYFIKKDGTLQKGRDLNKTPAAQRGHNSSSIAICLHGLDLSKFTRQQRTTLRSLAFNIMKSYGRRSVRFRAHNEVANKACPVVNIRTILDLDSEGYWRT